MYLPNTENQTENKLKNDKRKCKLFTVCSVMIKMLKAGSTYFQINICLILSLRLSEISSIKKIPHLFYIYFYYLNTTISQCMQFYLKCSK